MLHKVFVIIFVSILYQGWNFALLQVECERDFHRPTRNICDGIPGFAIKSGRFYAF